MQVTVYGLASTENMELRYVGQTVQPLKKRLYTHVGHARNHYHKSHASDWIRSVLKRGYEIHIFPLEENAEHNTAEIKWVAKCKAEGVRLVNGTDGGGGTLGMERPPMPEEIKAKIRLAKAGTRLSEAHKQAIGRAHKNKFVRDETRQKISQAKKGHTVSEETRAKISLSLKGRPTAPCREETKAKLSAANKGKTMSAESKAKMSASKKGKKREGETLLKWRAACQATRAKKKEAALAEG